MRTRSFAWGLPLLLLPNLAFGADPTIAVDGGIQPSALGPGETGKVEIEIDVPDGWHLWSLDPGPGPLPLKLTLPDDAQLEWSGPWHGDEPHIVFDRGFERELAQYESGKIRLQRLVKVRAGAAPGDVRSKIKIRGQICTEEQCLEQRKTVDVALTIADFATGAAVPKISLAALKIGEPAAATAAATIGSPKKKSAAPGEEGLFSFILAAFAFGILALATPCVFPAIPLTVSFFSKYSEESFGRGARLAGTYAGTMVIAFTAAGVLISILFGVTGVQRFAAHPAFNVFLGGVLVFFALNLLGLFEIRAPTFMTNSVNKLEMKFGRAAALNAGADAKPKSKFSDYVVVIIAALTATTVFFTCTVGFVGLVLVTAARGEWIWPTIGMLSFSTAFSLPFFFLALFPQAARRLQGKGGGWLGATRVTLGFLELAAAMKFLSNADLVWEWGILTRDLVLALWIPLFVLCGLYLLGKIRIGHESAANADGGISVVQMLFSTGMFALSLYLAVGMFNARSFGGWIDGWLPPLQYPGTAPIASSGGGGASNGAHLKWIYDLEEGRAKAKAEGKLVFLNYTGVTCTNCRYMEGGVFPRPEIASLLGQMTLVELYTDRGTPADEKYREDQVARFDTAALPFYSVERPDGTVIATFPSSTNDVEEFRRFLADAIAKGKSAAPAPAKKAPPVAVADGALKLKTTQLADGQPGAAIVPGKWNLVNFWATWCAPCKVELREFMADVGKKFEERGHNFTIVAVEEDESVGMALEFTRKIGVADGSALRLPSEFGDELVDPKLEFDGSGLPYTVLVSPKGEVVWKHKQALTEAELEAVLIEHTGYASR